MKVFISSVRRGLEAERDALPGLIAALAHEPKRFEDYTAQGVPSRQACLDGVRDADVYLLVLGEIHGDPLSDSGLTPTEEEFVAARTRGIPILVFLKRRGTPDDQQQVFIARVSGYVDGRFRKGFADVGELLTARRRVDPRTRVPAAPSRLDGPDRPGRRSLAEGGQQHLRLQRDRNTPGARERWNAPWRGWAEFSDVVKSTVYLSDFDDFAAMNEVYREYFGQEPPVRFTTGVTRLLNGARIEVEVIAAR